MNKDNQPEALRWADAMESDNICLGAAAELRRLHEMNGELLEALKAIMEDMDSDFGTDYDYENARAAIARAEATQ